MKSLLMLLFIFIISNNLLSQKIDKKVLEERQDKLDVILQMQDTRTIYDGKLVSFLTDIDPVIRARAVLAFGSIQDTSVISLLVDRFTFDTDPQVRMMVAFAIGQTAGLLSKKSRQTFEHDLIWNRLDLSSEGGKRGFNPKERLIEEIGKFGTEEGLNDLILRFGDVYPPVFTQGLTMSIARCAIRNIVTREAIQYLLKSIKPVDAASWQTMYALQRIGNHPEIRSDLDEIVQLYKHHDPLVRMNLAALLGKIKDEKISLEPLQKLADFDGDWRVRVNALRALSNYDLNGKDEIVRTFKRSFLAGNTNLSVTALSTFGNTGLKKENGSQAIKETFALLEKIAVNKNNEYQWQLQAEAATSIAKLEGKDALAFIKPTDYPQPLLQSQLLVAMGTTGSTDAMDILFRYIGDEKSVLYRSVLEGLNELSKKNPDYKKIIDSTYNASVNALKVNDVAVVATAAGILGDSLFARKTSVSPLLETLSRLRAPDDVESIQEILSTLGKLKDDRAIDGIRSQLEQRDRSVVHAAASALKAITGKNYSSDIPNYFEPNYTDFDFKYLHSLPDTFKVKMETIRGDVVMELYKYFAPFTVMSFTKLATQRGFYRGLPFHRIVPNFVIQGGDPRGDGWGGPGYSIRSEFSPLTFERGMVGIASSGKDTEGSQFFIVQSPQPHLDGRYTIFGKVISGMDIINKIQLDDHIYDIKIIQ
jgi:cyclophilin family peptidyl-prolyl cis-trans isomerase/HEAT repeat protein